MADAPAAAPAANSQEDAESHADDQKNLVSVLATVYKNFVSLASCIFQNGSDIEARARVTDFLIN